MTILLIGPEQYNSTDGVIITGIKYLLREAYPTCRIAYKELWDTTPQISADYLIEHKFDIIAVCGTPWIWDSFQNSLKWQNLKVAFKAHPEAKKLFMGIGSCLYLKDVHSDICRRPQELDALKEVYSDATVIVRDNLAASILDTASVDYEYFPCPAYFCYGNDKSQTTYEKNILLWTDPTATISKGGWTDRAQLEQWYDECKGFVNNYDAEVYCAKKSDIQGALNIGLKYPILLNNYQDTLNLMRVAKYVLSGRVHCAVPAIAQGADVKLMPLDSRSLVVSDWKDLSLQKILSFKEDYIKVLSKLKG